MATQKISSINKHYWDTSGILKQHTQVSKCKRKKISTPTSLNSLAQHVRHKTVTLPVTVNVGRRCGWEANQHSSSRFHQPPNPNLSSFPQCFFSPYFLHLTLIFSPEFKQKRLLCPLILLLTINLIVTHNCKTLLSTSFKEIYEGQGEDELAWN